MVKVAVYCFQKMVFYNVVYSVLDNCNLPIRLLDFRQPCSNNVFCMNGSPKDCYNPDLIVILASFDLSLPRKQKYI